MPTWDYWHRIEYRREISKDNYVHAHTELADDHGWTFCHDPERRQQWLADYTRACAADFLSRQAAKSGTWRVSVWRTGTTTQGQGEHICSIKMRWPTPASQRPAGH